jgi:ribosomal-protein-alanine N-acetyltransferase
MRASSPPILLQTERFRKSSMTIDEAFTFLPEIKTPRLQIRQIRIDDAESIFALKSDPEVTKQYGQKPHLSLSQSVDYVRERLEDYKRRNAIYWVFDLNEGGIHNAVGSCCFWNFEPSFKCAELGYELQRKYWGKGIMSEALVAIISYGFDQLELKRIEALPLSKNEASKNLLEKLGFKLEGILRRRIFFEGVYEDQLFFGVLNEEWMKKRDHEGKFS